MNQRDREEQQLEDDLFNGAISQSEFNKEMRDLNRWYRDSLEEEAQEAYNRVIENGQW